MAMGRGSPTLRAVCLQGFSVAAWQATVHRYALPRVTHPELAQVPMCCGSRWFAVADSHPS